VQIPAWGAWWLDVDPVGAQALAGAVTVKAGGVTLKGTVVSGGASNGRSGYRIVGGKGGWGRTIVSKGYADDGGVKLATVARDAAALVGETLGTIPTTRVGPHFARANDTAAQVLHAVAPRAWYVDFDGVTQFGRRPTSAYSGAAPRTRIDPAFGVVDLAVDSLAGLVPGVTVDGFAPAVDVEWVLEGDRLTARIYSGATLPRRLAAFDKILRLLDPRRIYRAAYEYRVVSQSGHRFNLQIVRAGTGLPDLARVPTRPGMAGHRANVQMGELVLVTFIEGDPARPVITSHDAPDAPGWNPSLIEFGEATDFFALAGKVDTAIAGVNSYLDTHTHPTGVGPSGPPTAPTTPADPTACAKVRGE
jgi:hypothetical protein